MSQPIPHMKSGFSDDLTQSHKVLLMSLLSVYVEEVAKTALLYAVHNERSVVSRDDMIKAMRFEILSETGAGSKLKAHIKEAMEYAFIENCQAKPEAYRAVMNHMGDIDRKMPELGSAREQSSFIVRRILGEEAEEKDGDGDGGNDDDDDGDSGNDDDDDDDGNDDDDDDDGNDDDGDGGNDDDDEEHLPSVLPLCTCDMCSLMNHAEAIWSNWSPSDDLEKLIYTSLQKAIDSHPE